MFRKIVLYSAAMLLLASYTYSANVVSLKCGGDMSPADCKKEFGMEMDKGTVMMVKELLKTQMTKIMDMFTAVKNGMPADGMHAKALMQAMDDMKTQMGMLDNMDDMDKTGETMRNAFMSMQPNFMKAQTEDSSNTEKFNELMEKQGFTKDLLEDAVMMMLKDFESMTMDMLNSLRSEDMKEYPQYMEMKETMKTMMETTENIEKMKMAIKMMKMMTDFTEAPRMKEILNTMTTKE